MARYREGAIEDPKVPVSTSSIEASNCLIRLFGPLPRFSNGVIAIEKRLATRYKTRKMIRGWNYANKGSAMNVTEILRRKGMC